MSRSAQEAATALGIRDTEIVRRLTTLDLTPNCRLILKQAWASADHESAAFIRRLYDRFRATPPLRDLLKHESRVERLMALQHEYLRELFCDPIDGNYVLRRLSIGLVHQRIRVTPQWYLASYARFLDEHVELLMSTAGSFGLAMQRVDALNKSIMFDAALALDAYGQSEDEAVLRRRQSLDRDQLEESAGEPIVAEHSDEEAAILAVTESKMARIRLSDDETRMRAEFIGLDAADLAALRSLRGPVIAAIPAILAEFYSFIQREPVLSSLVKPDQVQRLTRQVGSYWREFVEGTFDRSYAASRMRIGVIHEMIGLGPQWYLVGLARQVSGILRAIPEDHPDITAALRAFFKALVFDVTFVIDAYMSARAASLMQFQGYAQQLMVGLTSAVAILNAHGRIRYANDSFIGLAGIPPALLHMMPLGDVLDIPELQAAIDQVRQQARRRVRCVAHWAERLFRMTVMELEESIEKRHHSIAVVFDDVSDLVRLSDGIEQDARQYQRLTAVVSAVLWEMDWQTETIVAISHPSVDLLGYRDVAFLGRPQAWCECIVPEDRERFRASCLALRRHPQAVCEYRMRRADEREIWVRSHLTRLVEEPLSIAAVTIDVTSQRESERLRQAALEHVTGSVAHVINNALTVISGNIELSAASHSGRYNDPPDSHLHEALLATRRTASVVGKLQAFAGTQLLRPRPLVLNDLLEQSLPSLRVAAGPTVVLHPEFEPQLWQCRVDAGLLVTALSQLCDNARQAMPGGGSLWIRTRNQAVAGAPTDRDLPEGSERHFVEVEVADEGVGMPDSVRQRATEPFFTTTPLGDHLGLGLSMVHGFMTQSGGELRLKSVQGTGTSVTLRFPRLVPECIPLPPPPAVDRITHVLIVDGDPAVRQSTEQLVQQLGYHTTTASGAQDALSAAARSPVHVLLTEHLLADGSDGVTLARQLTALNPQLKVILALGGGLLDFATEDLPASWRTLEKPFGKMLLSQVLEFASADPPTARGERVLSPRESEVLRLIATGNSQAEVASLLGISERTVEQHVRNARHKLKAANTVQAVAEAIVRREISP